MKFDGYAAEERAVSKKAGHVIQVSQLCVKDAQKRIQEAEAQINATLAQKVPALKIQTARNAIKSAMAHYEAAKKEFDAEEKEFKHDMLHLDSVKNESTRVINLMNRHFIAREAQKAGKGLMLKNTLVEQDKMMDLLPAHNHARVGPKKESHEAI